MKKLLIFVMLVAPLASKAQEIWELPGGGRMTSKVLEISAIILILYLGITFIITIVKSILDHRLKSQMIEKGVPDKIVEQFLQPADMDTKSQAMKWFLILAGLGVGLALINFTLPFGIHSISIMAFCLALSFLGYYFFIRQSGK